MDEDQKLESFDRGDDELIEIAEHSTNAEWEKFVTSDV